MIKLVFCKFAVLFILFLLNSFSTIHGATLLNNTTVSDSDARFVVNDFSHERFDQLVLTAVLQIESKEYVEAKKSLDRIVSFLQISPRWPEYYRVLLMYIELYSQQQKYELALSYVEQAELINTQHTLNLITANFLLDKASFLVALKRFDEANKTIVDIERITEQQFDGIQVEQKLKLLKVKAQTHEGLGQLEDAFLMYDQYIKEYRSQQRVLLDEKTNSLSEKYQTDKLSIDTALMAKENELKKAILAETKHKTELQTYYLVVFLTSVVLLIVFLVRQYRVKKQLKLLADTDSLSQLLNRRSIFKQGELLLNKAMELDKPLSVIMFDIDNFKSINDNYGHHIGDEVIRTVGFIGKKVLRNDDVFGRIGGEEFVALLPDIEMEEAFLIAERLRERFAQHHMAFENVSLQFTASMGVTALKHINRPTIEHLISVADKAMYFAKNSGKNKTSIFQEH